MSIPLVTWAGFQTTGLADAKLDDPSKCKHNYGLRGRWAWLDFLQLFETYRETPDPMHLDFSLLDQVQLYRNVAVVFVLVLERDSAF